MVIAVEENVLIFFMGAVFLPLCGLLVKLIIDIRIFQSKMSYIEECLEKLERQIDKWSNDHRSDRHDYDSRSSRR